MKKASAPMLVLPALFCLTSFALLNHWLARHCGFGNDWNGNCIFEVRIID